MGKGLFVTIVNNSSEDIVTGTSGVTCLYHSDKLDDLHISSGEQSLKYYLEGKGSGSCAFKTTTFTLDFVSDGHIIGTAGFTENSSTWSKGDASPNIQSVLTSGDQYQLVVTVNNSINGAQDNSNA